MMGSTSLSLWQHILRGTWWSLCAHLMYGKREKWKEDSVSWFPLPFIMPAFSPRHVPASSTLGTKPLAHGPLMDVQLQAPTVSAPVVKSGKGQGKMEGHCVPENGFQGNIKSGEYICFW